MREKCRSIEELERLLLESESRVQRLTVAKARSDHFMKVSLAVRNVNQLIASEIDPRRLIEQACRSLTESVGYLNAWITLLGEDGRTVVATAASGFDDGFAVLDRSIKAGRYPDFMKDALGSNQTIVARDPAVHQPDGPVAADHGSRAGLGRRLHHGGRTFGVLAVSVPADYATDAQEQALFEEVADDLAFALFRIDVARSLQASQRRYRDLFEGSRDGIVMVDPAGRIIDANQAYCDMLGYTLDELRSMPDFYEITPERWRDWEAKEIWENRLLGRGYSGIYEKEYIRKDGTVFPVELWSRAVQDDDGQIEYFWGTVRDISDRKQMEERAKEGHACLLAIFDGIDEPVYVADSRTYEILFLNRVIQEAFGAPDRRKCYEYLQGRHEPCPFCTNDKILGEYLGQSYVWEFRNEVNGRWYKCIDKAIPWPDGRLVRYEMAIDITEAKQAERGIATTLSLLDSALESTADGLLVIDRGGRVSLWNQKFADMWKIPEEILATKDDEALIEFILSQLERPEDFVAGVRELYKNPERTSHDTIEFADGRVFERYSQPQRIGDEIIGRVWSFRDVTERRIAEQEQERIQKQLNQAQRMESIGRLAGGVAHDFNNMLGVIMGYTELALEKTAPGEALHADLTQVCRAAEHSADITRQLLAFARKQTISPRLIDLNEAIEHTLRMLRRLLGEGIDITWVPGEDLDPVNMDPSQVDQILTNLCINARDAIGETGKIIIETGPASFDEEYCAAHPGFLPGRYVMLAVSDDGCGMETETIAHLFEPFFTTKDLDRGTGLGLATVYGIVKQNNGFINVYSEPGRGSTFKVYLSVQAGTAEPLFAEEPAGQATVHGVETILLVEDEPAILNLTRMMLERFGYRVLSAPTPSEAIALARRYAGAIHLLMTDLVMPEMNGRDLAESLVSLNPGLKALFMSGYTANVIAHHGVLDEGVHFIQKPFTMKDLGSKVRAVLDVD